MKHLVMLAYIAVVLSALILSGCLEVLDGQVNGSPQTPPPDSDSVQPQVLQSADSVFLDLLSPTAPLAISQGQPVEIRWRITALPAQATIDLAYRPVGQTAEFPIVVDLPTDVQSSFTFDTSVLTIGFEYTVLVRLHWVNQGQPQEKEVESPTLTIQSPQIFQISMVARDPLLIRTPVTFWRLDDSGRVKFGGEFTDPLDVVIQCPTRGAIIRYTTDGTDPNENGAQYSGPVRVTASTTIKAAAFLDTPSGVEVSDVLTATFTKLAQGQVARPMFQFDPIQGRVTQYGASFVGWVNLALVSGTKDAEIRYTTSTAAGTQPSIVFSGSILIDRTLTVRAQTFKGGQSSDVVSATFTKGVENDLTVLPSANVDVNWRGAFLPVGGRLELFLDLDSYFDSGNELAITSDLLTSSGAIQSGTISLAGSDLWGRPEVARGVFYFVGVRALKNTSVVSATYAPAWIRLYSGEGFKVLQPAKDVTFVVGTDVPVVWSTAGVPVELTVQAVFVDRESGVEITAARNLDVTAGNAVIPGAALEVDHEYDIVLQLVHDSTIVASEQGPGIISVVASLN